MEIDDSLLEEEKQQESSLDDTMNVDSSAESNEVTDVTQTLSALRANIKEKGRNIIVSWL